MNRSLLRANKLSLIVSSIELKLHRTSASRTATTIMEVMFAIGIMMVGLVGIASLIPLAARQASDSRVLTQATSLSQNAYREFLARSMHAPSVERPWLLCEDRDLSSQNGITHFSQPSNYYTKWNTPAYIPIRSFKELVYYQAGIEQGSLAQNPKNLSESAGYGARFSYCIDPMFMASQPTVARAVGSEYEYRRSRFPYYMDTLNPLASPTSPEHNWVAQPRMIRVTIPATDAATTLVALEPGVGTGVNLPMRPKLAERLFSNLDNLSVVVNDTDRSLNGVRGLYTVPNGTEPPALAQMASSQDLSWMATLSPLEQDTLYAQNTYTLSVVMFNNRDRTFAAPVDSMAGALDTGSLPTGEIIAYAEPSIIPNGSTPPMGSMAPYTREYSYGGANGFSVNLFGYAGPGMVDAAGELRRELRIKVGSWIMLSRRFYFSATGDTRADTARSKDIFKWYRVVGVGSSPDILPNATLPTVADPLGNTMSQSIWRQQVQLVGPDWAFRQDTGLFLPTTATIVPGVVSVYERIVTMPID